MNVLFEDYHIQSQEPSNTINLELPLGPFQRALRSAGNSNEANLRLTKRDGVPVLSMTIHTTAQTTSAAPGYAASAGFPSGAASVAGFGDNDPFAEADALSYHAEPLDLAAAARREREKVVTQDIPVRVLHPDTVETIMQPKVREPEVHIKLPPLLQLKAVSDRFAKLAAAAASSSDRRGAAAGAAGAGLTAASPKLELSANMHGSLRLRVATEALTVESTWAGLENPELDPAQLAMPLAQHPSTRFREAGPDRWATVRVDARDWGRVLSVGRLEGRVIACIADDHALVLYVYVPQIDDAGAEDSVLTVCPPEPAEAAQSAVC